MILAYLILAHLIADFVLQPTKLVMWKIKSKNGGIVHALVHFIVSTILLLPIIINGVPWLILVTLAISFIHFWIDGIKINYDIKHDKKVRPFIIDQMLHLLTILLIYFFIQSTTYTLPTQKFYQIYTNIVFVNFVSLVIFFTAVVEVFRYQKEREKDKKAKIEFHAKDMAKRVVVFSALYIIFMILAIFAFTHSPL